MGGLGGLGGSGAGIGVLTVFFADILLTVTESLLVPMVYLFIGVTAAEAVAREGRLLGLSGLIKKTLTWAMTVTLTLFCSYLAVGGAVAGGADRLTVKMTKMAVSGAVPVVGSILSGATETVLVSAALMKNAAGIYGILAVLAIAVEPFLRIGIQYGMLKLTAAVGSIFGAKEMTDFIGDFCDAMGLLLAMTGGVCLLMLISTVCFMKAVA